jgi:anti-sigma factor ChrR (cupin superfamily)
MDLRADFARREVVRTGAEVWLPSSMAGADHYVLDRLGEERARDTSIVRHAAGARFGAHAHSRGEEFLVLAGSLHDDAGDYPDGTYVRHPIGTAHPRWAGPDGAVVFVKLHQFAATDTQRVLIDTRAARWRQGLVRGLTVLPLYQHGSEHVALVRWAPSTRFRPHQRWGGEEILVLDGVFEDEHGTYPRRAAGSAARISRRTTVHWATRRADFRNNRPPRQHVRYWRSGRREPSWAWPSVSIGN